MRKWGGGRRGGRVRAIQLDERGIKQPGRLRDANHFAERAKGNARRNGGGWRRKKREVKPGNG